MKLNLSFRAVNLALVVLLILVMATTIGFFVPLGKARMPLTLADVLVVLAFVGVVLNLVSHKLRGIRLPPLQAFALVAIAVVVFARTYAVIETGEQKGLAAIAEQKANATQQGEARAEAVAEARKDKLDAFKEVLQFVEYFLVAFAVFVNVAETSDLKLYLTAFVVGTAGVLGWAAYQYFACESAYDVRAGYENRNLLGAYLALSLPMLYGLALYTRCWGTRIVLLLLVGLGLLVDLSGGALLVTVIVLGILSALRGQRALVPYLVAICAVLLFAPRLLPRPHHTDVLFSSVAPYLNDNYLLSDGQLVARAEELYHPTQEISLDHSGVKGIPEARPRDALRLLDLLRQRRASTPEEEKLYGQVYAAVNQETEQSYPLRERVVGVRYQRWHAALAAARGLWGTVWTALFGRGFTEYHALLKLYLPPGMLQYRTDETEVFNVGAPEPFTYNVWLKTLLQMGLLGFLVVAWFVGTFFFRADRLFRTARSELGLGVALGSLGSIIGFTLVGLFTENLGRGLAIPFVFILATIAIAERIVRTEAKGPVAQLTRYD